jgi:TonB family protein
MAATAQHLLGQLADGRFPLRKLLGVSQNSAVFLTTVDAGPSGDAPTDAAIKLIPEDPFNSDLQRERWRAASALSHPGLLRILHFGRCVIDGSPCLYTVSELADEDLGQLLPRRSLTPDETRGMLAAVLPALDFLHENGLVHAGLKPSNIHAIGDNVKLSADRIVSAGESSSAWPLAAPFAAPEPVLVPASDLWALGISLCETLTRNLPVRESSARFALPDLPAPFGEIVRSALVDDATLRITLDEVRALLDPAFVARLKASPAATRPADDQRNAPATSSPYVRPPESPDSPESILAAVETAPAARSGPVLSEQRQPLPEIDPLAVPLSPVTPPAARTRIPVSSLPQVNATIGGPRRVSNPPESSTRSNKLFLVSIAASVVLLGLFLPRYFLRSRSASSPDSANSSATSSAPEISSAPATKIPATSSGPASISVPPNSAGSISTPATNTHSRTTAGTSSPTSGAANPASRTSSSKNPPPSRVAPPPTTSASPLMPSVVHKVLPEVSAKARSTIRGTVRINVRVHLNPDGTVSTAELANPAPSEFFANLALKAARQWHFAPSASGADSTVRFDFTQTSTSASVM